MVNVIVVGGGMVGGYCAYQLARHGLKPILLERGEVASGASGRGGGLLLKGATDLFTPEIAPHLLANQKLLEDFLQETASDVEYLGGGSLYIALEEDWDLTQRKVKRLNESGIPAELWDHEELKRRMPSVTRKAVGGRFIPGDAQLASPKLATSFVQAARQAGAKIKAGVTVTSLVTDEKGSVQGVRTSEDTIHADWLILATNAYAAHLIPELRPVIVPTRGQAFLTTPLAPAFPYACAAHDDLEYWRQTRTGQILFGGCRRNETRYPNGKGTESTDTTTEVQQALRQAFGFLFPDWANIPLEKAWAGTMGFTPDYKPLIGLLPGHSNLLIAAGFSGNCLPLVCITGQLIREIVLNGQTSLALTPFKPGRFFEGRSEKRA